MPFKPDELVAMGLGVAFVGVLTYCLYSGEKPNRPIDSITDGLSRLWKKTAFPALAAAFIIGGAYVSCTRQGDRSPDCIIALDCEEPDR